MDADSSTEIKELDKLIPYFKDYDIVIGSRSVGNNSVIVPQGFIRRNIGCFAQRGHHR